MSWRVQPARWSLRTRIIAACLLLQLLAVALLVGFTLGLLRDTLNAQATSQVRQVLSLIEQGVTASLAQRDYATVQQTLDLVRADDGIDYVVVRDHAERIVASAGWDTSRGLPPQLEDPIDLDGPHATIHRSAVMTLAGQPMGKLDLGLSTAQFKEARSAFLRRSLMLAAATLFVSMLVLGLLAFAITRHLTHLARAADRVAAGDLQVEVPAQGRDEIAQLARTFNTMTSALRDRIAALEHSEQLQREHLAGARREQSRLLALLGSMNSGILFADVHGEIIYANEAFAAMWSLPMPLSSKRVEDIVDRMHHLASPQDRATVQNLAAPPAQTVDAYQEIRLQDDRLFVQRVHEVMQDGELQGFIWFHRDITRDRATQQQAWQALRDPLTGLYNRRGLYESLRELMSEARAANARLSLLFLDLDDFKQANEVGGHRTGDEILVRIGTVLREQLRRGETVARLGGDEFAVLCPGVDGQEAALTAATIVDAVASLRFPVEGALLRVGCSVGIAVFPTDASNEDDLIACADTAMYQAKQRGKNGWARYRLDPDRARAESMHANWNQRLHRAMQQDRLVLHFQPIHRANDLSVDRYEALVRLVDENDPNLLIGPAEFIAHAERSGKIGQLDRWVVDQCIRKLATTSESVRIAANLSARSLEDEDFPSFLRESLMRHDVDPRRLHIELTETSAITDPVTARSMIARLRSLGCRVELDDFGSGFNSFANLKLLDVDAIKIDGALVRDMASDSSTALLVGAIVRIAHNLNRSVVAEHVENEASLEELRALGVDLVQGFHLSRVSANLASSTRTGLSVVAGGQSEQRVSRMDGSERKAR